MTHSEKIMSKVKQLRETVRPGQKYYDLTVIGFVDNKANSAKCKFLCKCGNETTVRATYVLSGNTKSCGCRKKPHGGTSSPEHTSWKAMISRCRRKSDKSYSKYGGRGIKVCKEWIDSYKNFLDHIGPRPSKSHTLDRIDVNGNYEPGNVRWATSKQQARNRRDNVLIAIGDEKHCFSEWCEIMGISVRTVQSRTRKGIPFHMAVSTPVGTPGKKTVYQY